MKTKFILLVVLMAMAFASCRTSKAGCPASNYQGTRYKASKFNWYN